MMDASRISVIIPAYNAETTICEAIESCLATADPGPQIIVIDDGSTDGTAGTVPLHFGGRVVLVSQPNTGRAAARNKGLSLATGEFVKFLDADDMVSSEALTSQAEFLAAHPDIAVAYGLVEFVSATDPSERWTPDQPSCPPGNLLPYMVDDGFLLPLGTLVRREWCERIGGFYVGLPSNEDWDFWLRLATEGAVFARYPDDGVVGYYSARSAGTSTRDPTHLHCGVVTLERLRARIAHHEARELHVRRAVGRWRFGYGRALIAERRWKAVRQMSRGLLEDRRSWDFKLAWIVLGGLFGDARAARTISRLQGRDGN